MKPSPTLPKNTSILASRRAEDSRAPFPNARERTVFPPCKNRRITISICPSCDVLDYSTFVPGVLTFSRRRYAEAEPDPRPQLLSGSSLGKVNQLRVCPTDGNKLQRFRFGSICDLRACCTFLIFQVAISFRPRANISIIRHWARDWEPANDEAYSNAEGLCDTYHPVSSTTSLRQQHWTGKSVGGSPHDHVSSSQRTDNPQKFPCRSNDARPPQRSPKSSVMVVAVAGSQPRIKQTAGNECLLQVKRYLALFPQGPPWLSRAPPTTFPVYQQNAPAELQRGSTTLPGAV